ncbi:hypothetical protein WBG78_03790 [Chryseolinea sp. T2]|uniref:hypothetical protein n=1 Tax=Chryseolinea sp. T2 TaxID=3129255 RepID=UPI003077F035
MPFPTLTQAQLKAVQTLCGALFHSLVTYNDPAHFITDHLFDWLDFTVGQPYHWQLHGNGFTICCRQGVIEYKHDDYNTHTRKVIVGLMRNADVELSSVD